MRTIGIGNNRLIFAYVVIRELDVTEDWKNGLLRFSPTIAFQSRNETLLR